MQSELQLSEARRVHSPNLTDDKIEGYLNIFDDVREEMLNKPDFSSDYASVPLEDRVTINPIPLVFSGEDSEVTVDPEGNAYMKLVSCFGESEFLETVGKWLTQSGLDARIYAITSLHDRKVEKVVRVIQEGEVVLKPTGEFVDSGWEANLQELPRYNYRLLWKEECDVKRTFTNIVRVGGIVKSNKYTVASRQLVDIPPEERGLFELRAEGSDAAKALEIVGHIARNRYRQMHDLSNNGELKPVTLFDASHIKVRKSSSACYISVSKRNLMGDPISAIQTTIQDNDLEGKVSVNSTPLQNPSLVSPVEGTYVFKIRGSEEDAAKIGSSLVPYIGDNAEYLFENTSFEPFDHLSEDRVDRYYDLVDEYRTDVDIRKDGAVFYLRLPGKVPYEFYQDAQIMANISGISEKVSVHLVTPDGQSVDIHTLEEDDNDIDIGTVISASEKNYIRISLKTDYRGSATDAKHTMEDLALGLMKMANIAELATERQKHVRRFTDKYTLPNKPGS